MAGAANVEKLSYFPTAESSEPLVYVVTEMPEDVAIRDKAHQFLRLGSLALTPSFEANKDIDKAAPIESLKDAIHLAAQNDPMGRKVLKANVSTDVAERTMKVRYVKEIELEVDDNEIHQYGHSLKKVQLNSWQYAAKRWQMRERIAAENRNAFRLQHYYDQGKLEDHSFVEISMAADNMDKESMDKVNFFTDTMSCAIRVTTIKDGVLTMQSGFAAGVKKPGGERHDKRGIMAIGKAFGIDFEDKQAAEVLDTPFLVHNTKLPNGVLDAVKLYDEGAGGTYWGEDKTQGDYQEVITESKRRDESFGSSVDDIMEKLIAAAPKIRTLVDAARMLNKLSGQRMVKQAMHDPTINANVFGREAAVYIERSRHHLSLGNYEMAYAAMNHAQQVEKSGGCAGEVDEPDSEVDAYGNPIKGSSDSLKSVSVGRDKYGSRKFKCSNGHLNIRKKDELIDKCQHAGCRAVVKC